MQWMMERVSTGYGPVRDFANTKMNLPIPCNKGEIIDCMGAWTPDLQKPVPFIQTV